MNGLKISSTTDIPGIYGFKLVNGIITDGLILHLDAGNPVSYPGSGTIWYDLIGTNNAVVGNLPTFQTTNCGQFNFNGSSNYFNLINQITLQSLSIWINVYNVSSVNYFLGNKTNSGGIRYNGSSWLVYASSLGYTTVSWTKIDSMVNFSVRRHDTVSFDMFINGIYIGNGAHGGTGNSVLVDYIGRRYDQYYYTGSIAIIQIYNRALTDIQIIQNYNANRDRFEL